MRVRDLVDIRMTLWVQCLDCHRDVIVNSVLLEERGLGMREVKDLRFRCSACGSHRVNPRLDDRPLPQ
jgi:hypothetical protein